MMITGDHPHTAARIAGDLGIVEPGARALTGAEIEALDDEGLSAAVRDVPVYARVAPEHSCGSSTRCRPMARSSR
jgi:Ca2+-transporting ATPase